MSVLLLFCYGSSSLCLGQDDEGSRIIRMYIFSRISCIHCSPHPMALSLNHNVLPSHQPFSHLDEVDGGGDEVGKAERTMVGSER